MISEATKVKAKYRLGVFDETKLSKDGHGRCVTARYVLVSDKDNVRVVRLQRSVQRLSLNLPVEEKSGSVVVKEHEFYVECLVNEEQLQ